MGQLMHWLSNGEVKKKYTLPMDIIVDLQSELVIEDKLDSRGRCELGKPSELGETVDGLLRDSRKLENWFSLLWRASTRGWIV